MFQFLTPQVFDALIWGVILVGLVLSALRLYRDLFMPRQSRRRTNRRVGDDARENQSVASSEAADQSHDDI